MKGLKRLAKKLRDHAVISHALASLLRPVQRCCSWLDGKIRWNVRVNGGAVFYDGIRLMFPRGVGLVYSSLIFWEGVNGYEPHVWRVLRHFIERSSHFMDIGANIGFYTVLAQKIRPGLLIDAFEPVPDTIQRCRQFLAANGADPDCVHPVACSDRDGVAPVYVPAGPGSVDDRQTASLRPDSWQAKDPGRSDLEIVTVRLDTFLKSREVRTPLLIKIDVEDFEAGVLRGMRATMRQRRPVILLEMLPREHRNQDSWEVLAAEDYSCFAICKEGLFRVGAADASPDRTFTDFLCLPAERAPTSRNFLAYSEMNLVGGVE